MKKSDKVSYNNQSNINRILCKLTFNVNYAMVGTKCSDSLSNEEVRN